MRVFFVLGSSHFSVISGDKNEHQGLIERLLGAPRCETVARSRAWEKLEVWVASGLGDRLEITP